MAESSIQEGNSLPEGKYSQSPASGVQVEREDGPLNSIDTTLPLRIDDAKATVAEDPGSDAESVEKPDDHEDYGQDVDLPPLEAKKKKKRKSRKPKSQRGLGKSTGFEDFFADTPLTPAQHAEERELYDTNLAFVDRILVAIARFERTRKLTPERRDVLYKYLVYGSVEVGPNTFQGGADMEDMDKEQIATTLTQASVSDDKHNLGTETSVYAVDFLGCIQGFLSRPAKTLYGFETRDQVATVSTTLERFMDYLLQHDVCPEYSSDVLAARDLCRSAPPELWDVAEATRRLPGDFNIACSTLFGGSYAQRYDGDTWWGPDDNDEKVFVGMKPDEASQVMHFGVAGAATEDVFAAYLKSIHGEGTEVQRLEVVSVQEQAGFEITRIVPPTKECEDLYRTDSQHFRPVGRVHAKPWRNPELPPEDLTPAEQLARNDRPASSKAEWDGDGEKKEAYVFFIESILQTYLRVGIKIEATVRTLNCGIAFFDDVLNVFPTFDEYLVNEMMVGWKAPGPVKGAFDFVEGRAEGEEQDGDRDGNEDGANSEGAQLDGESKGTEKS